MRDMLRYTAKAVPWSRVTVAAVLVVAFMELVAWHPWGLWPLEGTTVGLLAGAAAWCFDEQAAAVVDTAPRGLAWRTAARAPAVGLLALVWVLVVVHADGPGLFDHGRHVLVQGVVALAAGAAYVTWRRGTGEAMPGLAFAVGVVPATTAWALVWPFASVPIFPYGTASASAWATSLAGWSATGCFAGATLLLTTTEANRWHRPCGQPHTAIVSPHIQETNRHACGRLGPASAGFPPATSAGVTSEFPAPTGGFPAV
jgi:hypothetical protein